MQPLHLLPKEYQALKKIKNGSRHDPQVLLSSEKGVKKKEEEEENVLQMTMANVRCDECNANLATRLKHGLRDS